MPLGRVQLEQRKLALVEKQRELRNTVEAEQQELMGLPVSPWG